MQPVREIAIGKEVQAQHRREVGQGPPGPGEVVQPFEEQQGDQGCPNLDAQGVVAGAEEGLHLEVLLERLEEQLDLPTVLVDGADRRSAERQVVGARSRVPCRRPRRRYGADRRGTWSRRRTR